MHVCHNDGNRQNNALTNLRHDTPSANMRDTVLHGTHPETRKTHCPRGHAYDDANTIHHKAGYRICRICQNASRRAYRAAKKAASATP